MIILLTIYGAMFSGSPVAGGDTDFDNIVDEADEEVIENYKAFADNWNIYDSLAKYRRRRWDPLMSF